MSNSHNQLEEYRKQIKSFKDKDEVAWVFLNTLNDLDAEVGIYYIFEPNDIVDSVCISIVSKLERLGLASKLKTEFGNKNYYMKINEVGRYALERFKSMAEYEEELLNIKSIANQPNISNYGNINMGDIHGTLNQSSSLERNIKKDTNPPMPYDNKQSPIISMAVKFIKYILIPLLVGTILVYIENFIGFFKKL